MYDNVFSKHSCEYFVNPFTKEELEKLHTKQLLKWEYRGGGWSVSADDWFCDIENCVECKQCYENCQHNSEIVKSILATREHISNKKESKQLRKERIKRGV